MTVITGAPSVAGISAAELETAQDAAAAFRERFTGGQEDYLRPPDKAHYMGRADLFGVLTEPFFSPPPDIRAWCIVSNNGFHFYR
jgi:hypothetical protein